MQEAEYKILCVDDDADDLTLLKDAIQSLKVQYKIMEAHDGEEGINMLHDLEEKGDVPCLIVLDINMPKMDGRQAFTAIKSNAKLANIPIVIFSTSSSKLDKMFFEKKNVEYFVKPINFEELQKVAKRFLNICDQRITNEI